MTTIVACARDGVVYAAADTCTNVYDRPIIDGVRKLHRLNAGDGEVLLGFTGDGGLCQAVTRTPIGRLPEPDDDTDGWAHTVALAITEIAVAGGFVVEGKQDGSVLLGWAGRLWTLVHNQAIAHPDGCAALGSGEGPAIGALDALLLAGWEPAGAVMQACAVGINRDRYSAGPITVEVLHAA